MLKSYGEKYTSKVNLDSSQYLRNTAIEQLVVQRFQHRIRNLCAVWCTSAAQSGISFAQQTKLVFIFSPRTPFLVKAKERIKMACNGEYSHRMQTVRAIFFLSHPLLAVSNFSF